MSADMLFLVEAPPETGDIAYYTMPSEAAAVVDEERAARIRGAISLVGETVVGSSVDLYLQLFDEGVVKDDARTSVKDFVDETKQEDPPLGEFIPGLIAALHAGALSFDQLDVIFRDLDSLYRRDQMVLTHEGYVATVDSEGVAHPRVDEVNSLLADQDQIEAAHEAEATHLALQFELRWRQSEETLEPYLSRDDTRTVLGRMEDGVFQPIATMLPADEVF